MSEEEHNRQVIKGRFEQFNLPDDLIEEIRLFAGERWIDGFRQAQFEIYMDNLNEEQNG